MASYGRNSDGDDESLLQFKHFIKPIWPEAIQKKKLMLPLKFVTTFRDEIFQKVCLEVPNGRVWSVGLTRERRDRNRVWLDSGLGEFLSFYAVRARNFLIFKYLGGSLFQVVICDETACEITYPAEEFPAASGGGGDSDDSESDGDDDDESAGEDASDSNGGEEEHSNDAEPETESNVDYRFDGLNLGNGKGKQAETRNRRGGDASGSRRRLPRAAKQSAGTSSAGQRNKGKRPLSAEEEDSDTSTDSHSTDHRRSGKGKRRDGGSGSRRKHKRLNAAQQLAQIASGRDGDLWRRLMASKIDFSTKLSTRFLGLSPGSKRGVEKAINCSNPNSPSVLVVLRDYHIHPGLMYMPIEFAKKYFARDSEGVTLRAYEGRTRFLGEFHIRTARNEPNFDVLYLRGWGDLRSDNELADGDVCLFELVDKKNMIFDVRIFRA